MSRRKKYRNRDRNEIKSSRKKQSNHQQNWQHDLHDDESLYQSSQLDEASEPKYGSEEFAQYFDDAPVPEVEPPRDHIDSQYQAPQNQAPQKKVTKETRESTQQFGDTVQAKQQQSNNQTPAKHRSVQHTPREDNRQPEQYQSINTQQNRSEYDRNQTTPSLSERRPRRRTRYRKQSAWKLLVPESWRAAWILTRRALFHLPINISQGLTNLNRNIFLDPDVMRSSYVVPDTNATTLTEQQAMPVAQSTYQETTSYQSTSSDQPAPRRNVMYRSQRRVASRWFPSFVTALWIGFRRKLHHWGLYFSGALDPLPGQYQSSMVFPSTTRPYDQDDSRSVQQPMVSSRQESSYSQTPSIRPPVKNELKSVTETAWREPSDQGVASQPEVASSLGAKATTDSHSTTSHYSTYGNQTQNYSSSQTTTTRLIRRQQKSSPFVWRLMGVAGIIGIILMLLQPFFVSNASKPLSIPNQPIAELQFQLLRFDDMSEQFQLVSIDPTIQKNQYSHQLTPSNDLWKSFSQFRQNDDRSEAAYFSPLGETTQAAVVQVRNLVEQVDIPAASLASSTSLESVVIDKQIPKEVVAYQPFEYTLLVRNETETLQRDIVVEEVVPAPHRITNVTPHAYHSNQTLRWDIKQLNAGETKQLSVRVLPLRTGSISTVATWSVPSNIQQIAFATEIKKPRPPEPIFPVAEPEKPISTFPEPEPKKIIQPTPTFPEPEPRKIIQPVPVVHREPELQLALAMPQEVSKGRILTLQVRVSNVGNGDAENIVVSYEVPDQLACKLGKKLDWTIKHLPAGKTKVGTIALRAEEVGSVTHFLSLEDDHKTVDKQSHALVVTKPTRPQNTSTKNRPTVIIPNPCNCIPTFISQ